MKEGEKESARQRKGVHRENQKIFIGCAHKWQVLAGNNKEIFILWMDGEPWP